MVSKTDWSPPPQSLVSTQLDVWRLMEVVLVRAHICHGHHGLYSWRKNCHVEKFQLSMYDNCGEIENFSTCGEISVQFMGFYYKSVIHTVLS